MINKSIYLYNCSSSPRMQWMHQFMETGQTHIYHQLYDISVAMATNWPTVWDSSSHINREMMAMRKTRKEIAGSRQSADVPEPCSGHMVIYTPGWTGMRLHRVEEEEGELCRGRRHGKPQLEILQLSVNQMWCEVHWGVWSTEPQSVCTAWLLKTQISLFFFLFLGLTSLMLETLPPAPSFMEDLSTINLLTHTHTHVFLDSLWEDSSGVRLHLRSRKLETWPTLRKN